MKTLNYNITGTTKTKIYSAIEDVSDGPTMTIANLKPEVCSASLFYHKENYTPDNSGEFGAVISEEIYYVLNRFVMSGYKTLTLDKTDFGFSNKGFDLYIQCADEADEIDVIANI